MNRSAACPNPASCPMEVEHVPAACRDLTSCPVGVEHVPATCHDLALSSVGVEHVPTTCGDLVSCPVGVEHVPTTCHDLVSCLMGVEHVPATCSDFVSCPMGVEHVPTTCGDLVSCPMGVELVPTTCHDLVSCPMGVEHVPAASRNLASCPVGVEHVPTTCHDLVSCPVGVEHVPTTCHDLVSCPAGVEHVPAACRDPASCPVGVEHVPSALLPSDPNMYWHLTEEETGLLAKLTNAYMAGGLHRNHVGLSSVASLNCDQEMEAVGQMAGELVLFFTAMPDFYGLHLKDQVAALAANGLPILLIRNAFAASFDVVHMPHDHVPHNTSHVPHNTSHVPHNTNYMQHSTNYIQHNTNHIQHNTNRVQLNTNRVQLNTNPMQHNTNYEPHSAFRDKVSFEVEPPERLGPEASQERGATSANATEQDRQRGAALVQSLCDFQTTLRPILRNDVTTAAILQCVVVFDASAPLVGDRQAVCALADKYETLLRHYVESQCSYLFSWQYLERMYHLRRQSRALAKDLIQHCQRWASIFDPFLEILTNPEAVHQ